MYPDSLKQLKTTVKDASTAERSSSCEKGLDCIFDLLFRIYLTLWSPLLVDVVTYSSSKVEIQDSGPENSQRNSITTDNTVFTKRVLKEIHQHKLDLGWAHSCKKMVSVSFVSPHSWSMCRYLRPVTVSGKNNGHNRKFPENPIQILTLAECICVFSKSIGPTVDRTFQNPNYTVGALDTDVQFAMGLVTPNDVFQLSAVFQKSLRKLLCSLLSIFWKCLTTMEFVGFPSQHTNKLLKQ